MRQRTRDESGGIGFAAFITMFFAYVIITVAYIEIIRVEPETPELQNEAETTQQVNRIDDQPFVPETPLPKGTVLDFTGDKALTLLVNTDTEKLPEDTPKQFMNYMGNTLPSVSQENGRGCVTAYTITQVSNFNISGAIGAADPETGKASDTCTQGLSVVWYLDETSWTWVSENFGVIPFCSELSAVPIYSEFVPECVSDLDSQTVSNPNGSLKDRDDA